MSPAMERKEVVARLEKLRPKIAAVFSFEKGKEHMLRPKYDSLADSFSAMQRHRDKIASQLMPDGRQAESMKKIAGIIDDVKKGKADPQQAVSGIHWEITTLNAEAEKALERMRNIIDETRTDLYSTDYDQNYLDWLKEHMMAPARHVTSTISRGEVIDELETLLTEMARADKPPKK